MGSKINASAFIRRVPDFAVCPDIEVCHSPPGKYWDSKLTFIVMYHKMHMSVPVHFSLLSSHSSQYVFWLVTAPLSKRQKIILTEA